MKQSEILMQRAERWKKAWELKNAGYTLKEVGLRLNPPVGKERARQLIWRHKRYLEWGH